MSTITAGFSKTCTARSGGMKTLWLIDQADITSFTLTGSAYSAVTPVVTKVFYKFEFEQDKGSFGEEFENTDTRSNIVTHSINFTLGGIDKTSRDAIQELIDGSVCGIIAIVEDQQGTKYVYGYSENFTTERAMRVSSGSASNSGEAFTDAIENIVVLQSTDNELARTFTGSVPV